MKCNEMQTLAPEHLRVIALRIQGKRWSEIAADLRVDPATVWRWREANPEIDRVIMEESMDYLVASHHRMASLLPLADEAIADSLLKFNEMKDRLTGAKMVRENFKRVASEASTPAPIHASGRLADDELSRVLDAG
jgi:hypothetical protein